MLDFKIWLNYRDNHYVVVSVPLSVLRQIPSPGVQAYLDWVERTSSRGPHIGEGQCYDWVVAAYGRGELNTKEGL